MVAGQLLALHDSLGWPWLRQMVLPSKVLLIGAESPLRYNPPSATSGFPLQPGCDVLNEHHGWELFSVSFHPWPWLFIFHWCRIYLSVYEATRWAWSDSDRHLIKSSHKSHLPPSWIFIPSLLNKTELSWGESRLLHYALASFQWSLCSLLGLQLVHITKCSQRKAAVSLMPENVCSPLCFAWVRKVGRAIQGTRIKLSLAKVVPMGQYPRRCFHRRAELPKI